MRIILSIILILWGGQAWLQKPLARMNSALPKPESSTAIPVEVLQVASLEYKAVVSDLFLLDALNGFGKTVERGTSGVVGENVEDWEWKMMMAQVEIASALDPYFLDPYYFANAVLTHFRPLLPRVNLLLKRGSEYREWDWELPFYVGFNYFYFLSQPKEASDWLMEASTRPNNKSTLLATLAARLAYKGQHTENAIVFLMQMIKTAKDPAIIEIYKTRLKSLQGIFLIEKAVRKFEKIYGKITQNIKELVDSGILGSVPIDPYGGVYTIDQDGKVSTTSNFIPVQ